jgi:hypothetical protein
MPTLRTIQLHGASVQAFLSHAWAAVEGGRFPGVTMLHFIAGRGTLALGDRGFKSLLEVPNVELLHSSVQFVGDRIPPVMHRLAVLEIDDSSGMALNRSWTPNLRTLRLWNGTEFAAHVI